MILVPKKNLYLPERIWGRKRFQRGILCATAAYGTPAGGDIVDLQYAACNEVSVGGSSTAWIRVYASTTRIAEQWYLADDSEFKTNDVVIPDGNITNYQMKWDALSGDAPNENTVAEAVWHPLSSGHFKCAWNQGGTGIRAGACTVSIREGTGSVIDTDTWEGDAEVEEEEK